mgnify:CR=1 FL=1
MANLSIIQQRWNTARKIHGRTDEIAVPSGLKVKGQYILAESGAATPSHDPLMAFQKSIGFPTDDNGQTVNDRDYERDGDAQEITRTIADNYDSRALQTPVVVSKDGIVLSGNGRTMAGILAALNNTDTAYISYLVMFPEKYGFTAQDVSSFSHPRVYFRASDDYKYTTETFALFNAQDIKSQSKTEQAVKLGKLVDDETFHRIIRTINMFDTIGDFYNNVRAATDAINDLRDSGVISKMQYPEMFDGDSISQQAREILENVLIGKAFQSNADAVRQITAFKGVRKNIITALAEISNNIALGEYSLESETAQAIDLVYQARANGDMHQGDIVSGFARQITMFGSSVTVADYRNATVMMLADMINHVQSSRLKKVYAVYNSHAHDAASGQMDMFSGGVKSKQEILNEVTQLLNYGTKKEISDTLSAAVGKRRVNAFDAVQKDGDSRPVDNRDTATGNGHPIQEIVAGTVCGLKLPTGEVIAVKVERYDGKTAGIRTKGWNRYRVPASLIVPSDEKRPTLPDWFKEGIILSDGRTIVSIDRYYTLLSDGKFYKRIDILLNCSPMLIQNTDEHE